MIQLAIHEAINGRDLDYTIARTTMEEMMDGTATDIEMATLLTALRMKGETITEITACAEVMREKGAHIEPKGAVMDIVGTGGDEVGSFNISTTAAFVAAAGGVPVAKHGNRSVSSQSGAADVLEELGVVLSLTPEQNEKVLAETGICFLFAQGYHKSMKNVAPVRKGWASAPSSTCSARCPIRRARPCSCSACMTKIWSCRWRRCSPISA